MSTNNKPPISAGPAHGAENIAKPVLEAMQQGASAYMALPQKLMQANLEAMTSTVNFMNRCMTAQADVWSKIGSFGDPAKAAEIQRTFLESVSKDSAEEVTKLAQIAKKNFAEMSNLATLGVSKSLSPGNSS